MPFFRYYHSRFKTMTITVNYFFSRSNRARHYWPIALCILGLVCANVWTTSFARIPPLMFCEYKKFLHTRCLPGEPGLLKIYDFDFRKHDFLTLSRCYVMHEVLCLTIMVIAVMILTGLPVINVVRNVLIKLLISADLSRIASSIKWLLNRKTFGQAREFVVR